MQEYVTHAVVLHKEPLREHDVRYFFFTRRFGKVVGKATSARKITSKLAGHLEPGMLSQVRFVERNGVQIVDALKESRLAASPRDLRLLSSVLHEGDADAALWDLLAVQDFSWKGILRILGWDPAEASCEVCGKSPEYFHPRRQDFFCPACASKIKGNELIFIGNARI